MQTILSIRHQNDNPLTLALLLQDDLVSSINTETRGLGDFIRHQPSGTRIMTGYIRAGSVEVRRKFTTDLEKAASTLRPPLALASAAPFNPFVEIIETLRRFDSQPLGRRAIIVVSDGLDISRGLDSSGPTQSLDLQRAINEAQRRSVAIYSIWGNTQDIGWVRYAFDKFEVPYDLIFKERVKKGDLKGSYDVVVMPNCPSCDAARQLARAVRERFPELSVRVIELDGRRPPPESVVAAPTYLLDGRVVALGNPALEQLARAIRSSRR